MRKIISILFILMFFTACSQNRDGVENINEIIINEPDAFYEPESSREILIGDNLPIARALAVKMINFTFYDNKGLSDFKEDANFSDTQFLTLQYAQDLINRANPNTSLKIQINEENRDRPISYALWHELFTKMLGEVAGEESFLEYFGIEELRFVVLATSGNNSLMPKGSVITDKGPFFCEGIDIDNYLDTEVLALVKDNEILMVTSIVSKEPTIKNAFVVNSTINTITIFSGGAERTYQHTLNVLPEEKTLVNIKINANLCVAIENITELVLGKVLSISSENLELKDSPEIFSINEEFKVYSLVDGVVRWRGLRDVIVGSESVGFFINANLEIVGAVIYKSNEPNTLRVVIGDSNFKSLIHESVEITATDVFTLSYRNNISAEIERREKGEVVNLSKLEVGDRVFIETSENGKIAINSISRNSRIPEYRGTLEVTRTDAGFIIVNEVGLEEYLYSVVPSEMPVSYGLEALKAQAVTARSYAYNQFHANLFHNFGANIDDSVMSQVYNNTLEHELSTRAVNETKGEVLSFNENVISANFFSTSAGVTANNGEVWADRESDEFPTKSQDFLRSTRLYWGADYGDLTLEENARAFLKDWDLEAYDSHVSWFRWKLEMDNSQISQIVNSNLNSRYQANPALLKTLQSDGSFKSTEVSSIGMLKNIEVLERGQAGNIISLKITGSENTIIVYTEYNIRMLLTPKKIGDGDDVVITRKDLTEIANLSMMPSAYFTMERMTDSEGNILYVRFFGGGFGHGVGMSQNASKGMTDIGMKYNEVLMFFYEGTEIIKIY